MTVMKSKVVQLNDTREWILFEKKKTIEYNGKNNSTKRQVLTNAVLEMQELERYISPSDLTRLTSYITNIDQITTLDEMKSFIKEKTGKEYIEGFNKAQAKNVDEIKKKIKKYDDYLAFKRTEFKCDSVGGNQKVEYNNGQITKMSFVQK